MDKKLIVAIVKVREAGRTIPRHNLAFTPPYRGILNINEERISALNRHALIATLRDPQSGELVPGLNPLVDARLIRATCDEWILTGFERVMLNLQESDCAQSWIVRIDELVDNSRAN